MDYELHPQAAYSENAFIELACRQIEHGYPVIIRPREYTDTIFAIGFSNHGKTLKGLGFLDGDDQKNRVDFSHLNQYTGWYKSDCDMMTVKLSQKTMPLVKACANAFLKGITLLSNSTHCGKDKMQGYGMVIYRNWHDLLRDEHRRDAGNIDGILPHAFIHYESKLRTKQFFELCAHIIPDIDEELVALAIRQYDEILSSAAEIATIAHQRDSFSTNSLREKRTYIMEMLRRSGEQEKLALSYLQRASSHI